MSTIDLVRAVRASQEAIVEDVKAGAIPMKLRSIAALAEYADISQYVPPAGPIDFELDPDEVANLNMSIDFWMRKGRHEQ